jgi:carotenoid cleavage dioxygenase
MVHDFAVTAKHLVFLLPPLVFDVDRLKDGATIADSYVWQPGLGMRILVVDKNDLAAQQWFELPPGFVFHNGNAWEAGGKIYLDYVGSPDAWSPLVGMPKIMRGEYRFAEAKPHLPKITLVEIDLIRGKASQTVTQVAGEFPAIDPRMVGQRHKSLYAATRRGSANRPGFDSVARFERNTGKLDVFRYGDDYLVEEHLLVPKPGSAREDDGWLVGTALDIKKQAMLLSVFAPGRIADGPVAQARMERVVPVGFHGTFVPDQV